MKRFLGGLLVAVAVSAPVVAQVPEPCDLNTDGIVDSADLLLIRGLLNTWVVPGSFGDPNFDGVVNVADMRFCQLRCTFAKCAPL